MEVQLWLSLVYRVGVAVVVKVGVYSGVQVWCKVGV
jgi:hypothetical protein